MLNEIVAIFAVFASFSTLCLLLWLLGTHKKAVFPPLEPYAPVKDTEPLRDDRRITLPMR